MRPKPNLEAALWPQGPTAGSNRLLHEASPVTSCVGQWDGPICGQIADSASCTGRHSVRAARTLAPGTPTRHVELT